jgi:hypothetical protein
LPLHEVCAVHRAVVVEVAEFALRDNGFDFQIGDLSRE